MQLVPLRPVLLDAQKTFVQSQYARWESCAS
jgi:hypothetical protein